MMLAQVDEYRKVYAARKIVEDQEDEAYQNKLRRQRTLRMERELTLSAPKWIVLALVMGVGFGAIAGHNLMSRGVICDSVVCEVLRIDGNRIAR